MKKANVQKKIFSKRIKLILLLFIASLCILSSHDLLNPDMNRREAAVAHKDSNPQRGSEREYGLYLAGRGLFDDRNRTGVYNQEIPVGKAAGAVVAIDPGHGGKDCGTSFEKLEEKDISLDISLTLGEMLEKAGIHVLYTREEDEYIGLGKRAEIANEAGADLFLSIHCNSMEDDTSCNGSETLYKNKKSETGKVSSKKFAEIIQGELPGAISTKDNGIKLRPRLAVLVATDMPAIIAEVGYISNESDRAKLASEEYRKKAAEALYRGVIKALNEMK
ncbi:MAG: N-acetylmuramoyl-L-alanine amidase [Clostridia bacterium]|nr:N-acetylmuramoyl-L-alanine amidase [Clostridia bacterium]